MTINIWQTTDLDHYIAEEFFGWRWLSFIGIPIHGTPNYPTEQRVRQFFPPDKELGKQWLYYLSTAGVAPATGDEPLAYCYGSSDGPHRVPHFSGHESAVKQMEREIDNRNNWGKYQEMLAERVGAFDEKGNVDGKKLRAASAQAKCIAALASIRSKYITPMGAED